MQLVFLIRGIERVSKILTFSGIIWVFLDKDERDKKLSQMVGPFITKEGIEYTLEPTEQNLAELCEEIQKETLSRGCFYNKNYDL
jgi:hypothetical protein